MKTISRVTITERTLVSGNRVSGSSGITVEGGCVVANSPDQWQGC